MIAPVVKARCPGHITGFFEICKNSNDGDARYIGSRGAGVCISHGVETDIVVKESSETEIKIKINGKESSAPVTRSVMEQFLKLIKKSYLFLIDHDVEIPISAGFGASGAGALSTAFALNDELGLKLTQNAVATIAHIAEVKSQTGLGDVIAQTHGGIEIRLEPGAPGLGRIDNIIAAPLLNVVCVNLGKLETKSIISNPAHQKRINIAGKKLVAELMQEATIENFMRLSKKFMEESGLLSENLKDLLIFIEDLYPFPTSMVMLGESLFTFAKKDKCKELEDEIQAYSSELLVFSCDVDYYGPRIVEVQ